MKFGYGYNRTPRAFAPYGCDRVYVDDSATDRQERTAMMEAMDNPQIADSLILFQRGDIGAGREVTKHMDELAAMNVEVEVIQAPPPAPVGRPKVFNPTDEQAVTLERLWRSSLPLSHILVRAGEVTGQSVKRHQLIYRFGPRWKTVAAE